MSFVDPLTVQNPTTNVVAVHGWMDALNAGFNWLRGPKAGCSLSTVAATVTGTDTIIPFATEVYDVNGCHSTVSNTGRITVPANWAGMWLVGADIRCNSGIFTMSIVRNGTVRFGGQSSGSSGSTTTTAATQTFLEMAVGDYVEVWVTGGTAIDTAVASRFYAHWMFGIL